MRILPLTLLACALSLPLAAAAKDYTILKIGENEVTRSQVQRVWEGLFPPGQAPEFESFDEKLKQNVLRGIVSEYTLYEEAQKQGFHNNEAIEAQLAEVRRKLAVKTLLDKKSEAMIKESDVKAEYDKLVRELRDEKEVRARHILVEDEAKANELKKQLDDGADFEALAKENSADKGSATQGGDLGYFRKGTMVKPFADAAFALKKNEVSEPVKSDFGWHIIKKLDVRDVQLPTYSEVKERLRMNVQEAKLNDYVEDLLDQTSVQYLGPDGKEKEFSKTPDSTKQ